MNSRITKVLLLGLALSVVCGFAFAAEEGPTTDAKPDRPDKIVPGSPHRAPELAGLPHIELGDKQVRLIEGIVKNNQEGVAAANKAIHQTEKALAEAKKEGKVKAIERAAEELGKAIGQKAVLDVQVVSAILEVLTERQQEELAKVNAKSRAWQALGKLSAPEKSTDAAVSAD